VAELMERCAGAEQKSEQNENLVYEFRKESFTAVYEVEKTFI
jgi:hypothetical protein